MMPSTMGVSISLQQTRPFNMSELKHHANEALADIGYLGDILDALDSVPDDKADADVLLRALARSHGDWAAHRRAFD